MKENEIVYQIKITFQDVLDNSHNMLGIIMKN